METGRFGFAGSTTAQVYKGRYMDNRYGAGTAPSALRPLDFVLKKAPTHNVDISQDTGPFDIVKDEAVLVLTDVENLSYGARDLGFKLSFQNLGLKLRERTKDCELHAFFSREPGDERRVRYFEERGWIAHPRDIERVQTYKGKKLLANSDNMILLHTGFLVRMSPIRFVIVASGDGTLTCDIARFLSSLPSPRKVVTMSLAGSTSSRLDATKNPEILDNIEIGLDCMHRAQYPNNLQ